MSRYVSVAGQKFGEGWTVLGNGHSARHSIFSESLSVLTHHHGTSAWTAGWVGDIGSGETNSSLGQAVDVWGRDVIAAVTSEVTVAQVVDVDQNNIWFFWSG